jgi:hypothetical protein
MIIKDSGRTMVVRDKCLFADREERRREPYGATPC